MNIKLKGALTRYSDIFYVDNESQILKINMIGEDRYLIKDEIPFSVIWRGDNESSLFYAYLANQDSGIIDIDKLEDMNEKLQDKIESNESLKQIIAPLLGIVENGWYQIFYNEPLSISLDYNPNEGIPKYLEENHFIYEYSSKSKKSCIWVDYTILFTQDVTDLDKKRIEFYKESISSGKRPTIITMALADYHNFTIEKFKENVQENYRAGYTMENALHCVEPQFIIDGHHKAKAYAEMKEKASVLSLVRLQFKEDHENFLKVKDRYKSKVEKEIGEKIE